MPTVVQFRRGTSTQSDAFTGQNAELSVDTTNKTVRVHDGATAGGSRLATYVEVADRMQVANATSLFVNVSGDSMTGALAMGTNKITGLDTPTDTADAATKGYVDTEISDLIGGAPAALDTLNELAAALQDDADFGATITTNLSQKLGATASVALTGDVSGSASFSANAVSIATSLNASATATPGDITTTMDDLALDDEILANPAGYITINIGGTNYKLPYYS